MTEVNIWLKQLSISQASLQHPTDSSPHWMTLENSLDMKECRDSMDRTNRREAPIFASPDTTRSWWIQIKRIKTSFRSTIKPMTSISKALDSGRSLSDPNSSGNRTVEVKVVLKDAKDRPKTQNREEEWILTLWMESRQTWRLSLKVLVKIKILTHKSTCLIRAQMLGHRRSN